MRRSPILWLVFAALLSFAGQGALAEDDVPVQDAAPVSDVARLSVVEGEVSVTDSSSGEWGPGQVNAPLVGGDEIATSAGARAELQLDSQNAVRLGEDTQLRLAEFTRDQVVLEVSRGRIAYALGAAPVVPVQIATPKVAFQPTQEGFYTVAVAPDGTTRLTVRRGQAIVALGDMRREIGRGQTAVIEGDAPEDIRIEAAALPDAWEGWAIRREDEIRGAKSWTQVNRNYVGAQDLDRHGDWRDVPEYGRVWIPRQVGPDWAPYREGYWSWKPYWGWVWVSNEPWGWAPYHYGRWVFINGEWAWWPGPVTVTYVPVWAPAYVAFIDFDHRHHPRPGHVAWLPLGPADWCHPWWSRRNGRHPGGHHARVHHVDRDHGHHGRRAHGVAAIRPLVPPERRQLSVLDGAQRDRRIRNAVSDLPAQNFGHRQRSSGRATLDEATFRRANLVVGGAPAQEGRVAPPERRREFRQAPAALTTPQPQLNKPMPGVMPAPAAISPQKIPDDRDRGERQFRERRERSDSAAPAAVRPLPMPVPDTARPAVRERPNAPQAPAVTVIRPQTAPAPAPTTPAAIPRPQETPRMMERPSSQPSREREFQRDTPRAMPIPSSPPLQQREMQRAMPIPSSSPPQQREMQRAAPQPRMERPVAAPRPAPAEPMRSAAPPVRIERPAPPPAAAPQPRQSPPPARNAPAKNCGQKQC